jgi:inner membrane protein
MEEQKPVFKTLTTVLQESPLARLLVLVGLMLLLLVPIEWIVELVRERTVRRAQAVEEVSSKWGRAQTVVGPAIVVPYEHGWSVADLKGTPRSRSETRRLTILPSQLHVRANVVGEERYRGIFSVPVYRTVLDVSGEFDAPDLAELGIEPERVDWKRSALVVGIADAGAIQDHASLTWDGSTRAFQPGPALFDVASGIHVPIDTPLNASKHAFAFRLTMNGSAALYFTAAGQETIVEVDSNWPSPSFQGNWLPVEHEVDADGFRATWTIPSLARNQPAAWTSESSDLTAELAKSPFGVELVTPVDAHRMADRSVKYACLFIVLTFGTIWLTEVLGRVHVHPIQYLMIGAALCTFYLLELSLAEQIGYAMANLLAASAVAVVVGLYSAAVLDGWRRAFAVASTVGGLYTYLYVLLTNEDYALLLGSIGIFIAVAVTMLATRGIDWYEPVRTAVPRTE